MCSLVLLMFGFVLFREPRRCGKVPAPFAFNVLKGSKRQKSKLLGGRTFHSKRHFISLVFCSPFLSFAGGCDNSAKKQKKESDGMCKCHLRRGLPQRCERSGS